MREVAEIESLALDTTDKRYVRAGEDFKSHTSPYDASVFGTVHMLINGREITHKNYLPAEFDLVDTARAQYEIIDSLERDGQWSGEPFCCTCSTRGCAYVHWEIETEESEMLAWQMNDLGGRAIGEHRYRCSPDVLTGTAAEFVQTTIDYLEQIGVDELLWAEHKETPVVGREYYGSVGELRSQLDFITTSQL